MIAGEGTTGAAGAAGLGAGAGEAAEAAPLRIGTRGSQLAVTQTEWAARRLQEASGRGFEIVRVTTHGDVNRASLSTLGGQGVFATELREALREGACELVVHSLKDLPTAPAPGLEIGAYPVREDARDALCSAGGAAGLTLDQLPAGAKVGTGSPRRIAQLRAVRPDLDIRDIRGNVDTRLGFVESGELDAVLLACAGLERLGRTSVITERLPLDRFPTAPGQGCLALERREGEEIPGLSELDDRAARLAVTAERAVLAALEAGCAAPLGASAVLEDGHPEDADAAGDTLTCTAAVYSLDGSRSLEATAWVADPDETAARELGEALAAELLERGAGGLLR